MEVIYLLIPVAIALAALGVYGFRWAVHSGQYDDTETPALRMLMDDTPAQPGDTPA